MFQCKYSQIHIPSLKQYSITSRNALQVVPSTAFLLPASSLNFGFSNGKKVSRHYV